MATIWADHGDYIERRGNVPLVGPSFDHEAEAARIKQNKERDRSATAARERSDRQRRLDVAGKFLRVNLDRLILEKLAPRLTEGSKPFEAVRLDPLFDAWKSRGRRDYLRMQLDYLETATQNLKSVGAVYLNYERIGLPDDVIEEASIQLRAELVKLAEANPDVL